MMHRHVHVEALAAEPLNGDIPPMAPQRKNGMDMSPDRVLQHRGWDKKLAALVKGNVGTIITVLVFLTGCWFFPVSQGQFEQKNAETASQIKALDAKMTDHEKRFDHLDAQGVRTETKIDTIILRFTPPAPAPIQASIPRRKKTAHPKPASGFLRSVLR